MNSGCLYQVFMKRHILITVPMNLRGPRRTRTLRTDLDGVIFNSSNYSLHALLINFLLITSLEDIHLDPPFKSLWLSRRSSLINRTRININTSWFTNTLSINFLWFDDENSIRKRFLALSSRKFIRENLDFDSENTLTKENVTSGRINEIADLFG